MKIKEFIEIIEEKKNDYPLTKQFILDGHGQVGGYSGEDPKYMYEHNKPSGNKKKTGSNEKEHVLGYLRYDFTNSYYQPANLDCSMESKYNDRRIVCKEYFICIAELSGVDSKKIDDVVQDLNDAVEKSVISNREWCAKFKGQIKWSDIKAALRL